MTPTRDSLPGLTLGTQRFYVAGEGNLLGLICVESDMEIPFPINGVHRGNPSSKQQAGTTYKMQNMRPFHEGRLRGGQRPGMVKWGDGDQIGGAEQPVVAICSVSVVESTS